MRKSRQSLLRISSILFSTNYAYNTAEKQYYTEEDVSNHKTPNDAWVSYKNKVYDITNFINIHPGGRQNILMGVGGPIDMYWNIYKQHQTKYVMDLLKGCEIGELKDYKKEEFENEYENEPIRENKHQIIHKNEPFNAELKKENILNNFITPEEYWFTRNHHPVPDIDIENYNLTINNEDFTYSDIIKLKNNHITTTIQCAGNRRSELNDIEKTMGLPWEGGAISTGKWTGVWLQNIIDIPKDKKYINLYDYDSKFSESVPIDTHLFIAYKMNDEILTRDHGYPLRVIAPGLTGSKNVKWIHKIDFSDEEVDSPWQSGIAYKIMPNHIKSTKDITPEIKGKLNTIDELKVQSYICEKEIDDDKKFITLRGYATAGKDKRIMKVEISDDNKKTWKVASIYKGKMERNRWCFWKITLFYNPKIRYFCRATDEDGNTQEHTAEDLWNIRGIANNSVCVG